MPTKKQTISVRLDSKARQRVERAARLMRQSSGAFLEKAGTESARQVLLEWAVSRQREAEASFSELAEVTTPLRSSEGILSFCGREKKRQGSFSAADP